METSITRFFLFFLFKFKKLNIYAIDKTIILIFSVNVARLHVLLKEIFRTSRTTPRWSSTKQVRATHIFIKDGMVDILRCIVWKKRKWSHSTGKRRFWQIYLNTFNNCAFWDLWLLKFSQKWLYRTSINIFFSILEKLKISANYK